jgi:hypothetical protein
MFAALSLIASPAAAAEFPARTASQAFYTTNIGPLGSVAGEADAPGYGRYGCRYRCRHRGVDAGDVVAGVLILGGIAAIASAVNNDKRKRRPDVVIIERDDERDYDRRERNNERDYDPKDKQGDYEASDYQRAYDRSHDSERRSQGQSTRGLESAVDRCVAEIERNVRVESVDAVDRTSGGWIVSGSLYDGAGFTCAIDANGRIDAIDYRALDNRDQGAAPAPYSGTERADGQWDDDRYFAAREANARSAQPTYPGGPLPGENFSQ